MDNRAREQAEFNDALGYLQRINNWFYIANYSSSSLNVQQWFHSLQILYRELSTYMKGAESESIKKKLDSVSRDVSKWHVVSTRRGGIVFGELYNNLRDIELALRKVYSDSGLQMRKTGDALDALR